VQWCRMEDTIEFFAGVLDIRSPWAVSNVLRDGEGCRITVEIVFERSSGGDLGGHIHGYVDREWRHLDTCQYQTFLRARVPRIRRPDGTTTEVEVPWAERFSRVTKMMEARVIETLQMASNHSAAAKHLGMSRGQLDRIMERAVSRGLARREKSDIPHIGLDEKAMRRGHRYVSVMTDIDKGVVVDLVEGRTMEAADELWGCLTPGQRCSVEAVAMDMWPAYMASAWTWAPNADVVHDRFHVASHLGKAVDTVRKREHKKLMGTGDDSLKGTKYRWLRRWDDLRSAPVDFRTIYRSALETAKTWSYKEAFDCFWDYVSESWARKFFEGWYRSVIRTGIEPMKRVARMLKKHLPGLLAYTRHRITNATAEGLNSKIQTIRNNARGLPKFETFRIRVLFHCGGLDLRPAASHTN